MRPGEKGMEEEEKEESEDEDGFGMITMLLSARFAL